MLPPPTFPDPAFHSPALLELIGLKVTEKFAGGYLRHPFLSVLLICSIADHLANSVIDAVDTALSKEPTAQNGTRLRSARVPDFKYFASNFIRNTSLGMPVLLLTLVYITRAKPHLRIERDEWAYERVFLGALIVALKVCSHPSMGITDMLISFFIVYYRRHTSDHSLGSRGSHPRKGASL